MSLGGVRDEAEIRGHRRNHVYNSGRFNNNFIEAGRMIRCSYSDEIDKDWSILGRSCIRTARSCWSRTEQDVYRSLSWSAIWSIESNVYNHRNTTQTIPRATSQNKPSLELLKLYRGRKRFILQRITWFQSSFKEHAIRKRVSYRSLESATRYGTTFILYERSWCS